MTPDLPSIVAAIVVHDGCLLLVRRRIAEGSLSWQFPAGEREHGETAEHAALREAAEEVGLPVRPVSYIGERDPPRHETAHDLHRVPDRQRRVPNN